MTDRKKLIDIIVRTPCVAVSSEYAAEHIIDHLLANGVRLETEQVTSDENKRWIPVTERLPEELPKDKSAWSERVLPSVDVLIKTNGVKQLYTAWYSYSHKLWTDVREEHCFSGVTHWMPLPNPPEKE